MACSCTMRKSIPKSPEVVWLLGWRLAVALAVAAMALDDESLVVEVDIVEGLKLEVEEKRDAGEEDEVLADVGELVGEDINLDEEVPEVDDAVCEDPEDVVRLDVGIPEVDDAPAEEEDAVLDDGELLEDDDPPVDDAALEEPGDDGEADAEEDVAAVEEIWLLLDDDDVAEDVPEAEEDEEEPPWERSYTERRQ
ncbi:MAG: hypothetical protein OHK93_004994 [Ramalina farinacea]|uniref:Uncharacterized protein n=1 Tax=Ramalina farinacea TaxID=258253 RepID=A0AA43QV63_9LECA|nr:hypothetical protein [Ramalina farinacea]